MTKLIYLSLAVMMINMYIYAQYLYRSNPYIRWVW